MPTQISMRFVLLLNACMLVASSQSNAIEPELASAGKSAVGYLQTHGKEWIEKRGCVSCHQIPSMLWSLNVALNHGIIEANSSDAQSIKRWTEWSVEPVNFVKPAQKKTHVLAETLTANIDTMAALMLAVRDSEQSAWRERFADHLCQEQADDGSWSACGQLPAQKRDPLETNRATTAWVTLALLRHGNTEFDQNLAMQFIVSGNAAESTELHALRLLLAIELHDDSLPDRMAELLSGQNADGGWGWLMGGDSDALGTGLALYALSVASSASTDDPATNAIESARNYLFESQGVDGGWRVPGTKKSAKGKPTPTSDYWGTAWALIALVATGEDNTP